MGLGGARHRQPDHSRGDANTLGGYAAVHDRPAAFEGVDGFSYSAEILVDTTSDAARPYAAYLFFVQWARVGSSSPMGHLESDYLVHADTVEAALAELGRIRLGEVTRVLNELIVAREGGAAPKRRWWDAMRAPDEGDADGEHERPRDE